MDRGSLITTLDPLRREVGGRVRKLLIDRRISSLPTEAIVSLDKTPYVLLLTSRFSRGFDAQTYVNELAFAEELAVRGRSFAVTDDPSVVFGKSVIWFPSAGFVSPRLWDYSRQVYEFASGLERQGNRLLRSSVETAYWENKAYMHHRLDEIGVSTPRTTILTSENRESVEFDMEPVVIKEEHSAGSSGIRQFETAAEARKFVTTYPFRPTESLIMQEIVRGAIRDLRVTMVGDTIIEPATYWRTKSSDALSRPEWSTTATTYNSLVDHGNIPESVAPLAADCLRQLGIRTAGIDLMWVDDDVAGKPLLLELSPYYQPNPPKPERYDGWTYKKYKESPYAADGYFAQQHIVLREIAGQLLEQELY